MTTVAAEDTLNIRSDPDGSSQIIGEYPPYAINIEVVRTSSDGKWGMVGMGERNGWVAMRYLIASDHQDPDAFPRPLTCGGTEPFWGLSIGVRGDTYTELGLDPRSLEMISESTAYNGAMAVFQDRQGGTGTLIVKKAYCNDGMSDREFGWKATMFREDPDGNSLQSGCCTLEASN